MFSISITDIRDAWKKRKIMTLGNGTTLVYTHRVHYFKNILRLSTQPQI